MYKLNWLLFLLFISNAALGQERTLKYCEIKTYGAGFSGKQYHVDLLTGNQDSLFNIKDKGHLQNLQKVTTLTSDVDVLNYMSNMGWKMFSVFSFPGQRNWNNYYFVREFAKSELISH